MTNHRLTSLALAAVLCLTIAAPAFAAQPPVGLGTADAFAVLAGSTVTNTGPSVVNGDLGVSPGAAVTGFPPGIVNGTIHAADAVASQAQSDTTIAYDDAAGRTPAASVPADLGGLLLSPGVYNSAAALGLTGDVTLDGQGDASAVFIFQVGSTLTTASGSRVVLVNGADACNVYWQVGSSATLGTNSSFRGTILALTAITLNTGANVLGRTLARNAAVTMDDNVITRSGCAAASTPGTTTPGDGTTAPGGTGTAPVAGTGPDAGGRSAPTGTGTAIFTTSPPNRLLDRCRTGFRARVTGLRIRRVVFTMDGRALATRGRAPFTARVPNVAGRHLIRARVTFTDATRAASFRFRYRACASARRQAVPRLTG